MTARLTDDEIHKLRQTISAATQGEWFQDEEEPHWLIADHPPNFPKPDGIFLAQFGGEAFDTPRPNDCAAVVAMRNAIDRLLDELLEHRAREAKAVKP